MERNLPEQILLKFRNGRHSLPDFQEEEEEKIFLQLQKYNLLYVTPQGVFKITKKGEKALSGNVEKHIFLERFENRLIKDSYKKNTEQKIIFFAIVPIIILIVITLIIFWFCK